MILHSYWRSTTSYRTRIILNLKGIDYRISPVNLLDGAQKSPDFLALNPSAGVPVLELATGERFSQSLAIIDYVDQLVPKPDLLPRNPVRRALALECAYAIALDIHPLNNLKVIQKLKEDFGADPQAVQAWMRDWMAQGFGAIEAKLPDQGSFTPEPGLLEACLIPQLYNAMRWDLDLTAYPKICKVQEACLPLPAFVAAHPDQQIDCPANQANV